MNQPDELPLVKKAMALLVEELDRDDRFAASVGLFGMLLRDSEGVGNGSLETVRSLAGDSVGSDPHGRWREFLGLVEAYEERGSH